MPAVTPIQQLPKFVLPGQYESLLTTTPHSFNDIPAVCRHKEENVVVSFDPPLPQDVGEGGLRGYLLVLTSKLIFMGDTGRGFEIPYPAITLHAISRAEAGPSIYCQLDESLGERAPNNTEEQVDVQDMRELTIKPDRPESLEAMFEALSQCAALHPDPADDDDDDDDAFVDPDSNIETFVGNEDEELSEVGKAALAHLESIIYNPFESAQAEISTEPVSHGTETHSESEQETKVNGEKA